MKPPFRYWFCRLYVLALWPPTVLAFLSFLYESATRNDTRLFVVCMLCMPLMVPVVLMVLSLGAFPFDYSAFGKHIRSSPPVGETPIAVFPVSGVLIRNRSRFPAMLSVYPSGLEINLCMAIGISFLPFSEIEFLERARRYTVVHHRCPEIRTPITIANDVANAIDQAIGRIPYATAVE